MGHQMTGRLPDFLGIGTQKGGTTTLQKLLEGHPGAYIPPIKEIHYFSLYSEHKIEWYKSHFREASIGQKAGEITPFYLFHEKASERIKKAIPNVKLIVLLRNPIERTISHVYHAQQRGFEKLEIGKALDAEAERMQSGNAYSYQKHSYVSRSKYLSQLERYEARFPKKNIQVIKSEDLFENMQKTWATIQEFLDLEVKPLTKMHTHANKGKSSRNELCPSIREKLKEELKETLIGIKSRYGIEWEL